MFNTAFHELLEHYKRLDSSLAANLTDDERLSLVFYRAESEYLSTRNIDEVHAPKRVRNWIADVIALDEFDVRHGRAPHKQPSSHRDPAAEEENRLSEWVDYRRDNWERLCSYQQERLLWIPSFELDPRGKLWDTQVNRYSKIVDSVGHAPVVTGATAEERLSARWAARVRNKMRRGLLPKHRADEVGALEYWWWER